MPSRAAYARRTSSGELQMETPSEPAPSTGLTTALKLHAVRATRRVGQRQAVLARAWCVQKQFDGIQTFLSVPKHLDILKLAS